MAEKNSKALFVVYVINRVSLPRCRFKRNSVVPQIWMSPASPFFQTAHQTVHSPLFFRKTIYVDRALWVMGRPYDFKCTEGKGAGGEGVSGFITIPRHLSTFDTHPRLEWVPYYNKFGDMHVHWTILKKYFSLKETNKWKCDCNVIS